MKIEQGKYYLQVQNGYVTDAVSYNPKIAGYKLFETYKLPVDIMNQCYQIIKGQLVLDQVKYQEYLVELEEVSDNGDN